MANFVIAGQRYTVNRSLFAQTISKTPSHELAQNMESLAELERCHNVGVLVCSPEDWDEVVGMAKDIGFELGWREFSQSCGITLEVR